MLLLFFTAIPLIIHVASLSVKSKKGGVWPPYMVKLEKGTVIKVRKLKRK